MKVFLGVGDQFPHVLDRLLLVRPHLSLEDIHAVHATLLHRERQAALVPHGVHNHWVNEDCELESRVMVEQEDICTVEGVEDPRILAALNRLAGGGHFCHVEYGIVVTDVCSAPNQEIQKLVYDLVPHTLPSGQSALKKLISALNVERKSVFSKTG